MIIVIGSDLHMHPYKEFSRLLPDGTNTRLADTFNALNAMVKATLNAADCFVFAGDLFHKRRLIDVRAHNLAHDALSPLANSEATSFIVRGNHDNATRDGEVHSVHSFRRIVTDIADEPLVREIGPKVFANFIPYSDDPKLIKEALKTPRPKGAKVYLCFGHFGVLGAVTGPIEYVPLEPIHIEDLPDDLYDFGFLGHYHRRQKLKDRWWYIGSPLQFTRGERDDGTKGYLTYDTDKPGSFKVNALPFPRFVTLTQEEIEKGKLRMKVAGNFVDVTLDEEPEGGVDAFKEMLKKLGAVESNVVHVPQPKRDKQRLEVHPGLAPLEMIEKYIKQYAGPEVDKKLALDFAKECLEEGEAE